MSFWKGIAQAIQEEDQQRFQSKEAEKAREARQWEIKEQRAYEQEMFMKKIQEQRKETLLQLAIKRQSSSAPTDEQRRAQMELRGILGGVEGGEDLMAAALADGNFATDLLGRYNEANELAKENKQGMITGQDLVNSFSAFGVDATPGDIVDIQAILGMDTSDEGTYWETVMDLSTGGGQPAMYTVKEERPLWQDPGDTLQEKQLTRFDQEVKKIYAKYASDLANSNDPDAMAELANLEERVKAGDTAALYDMFGRQAAEVLKDDNLFKGDRIIGMTTLEKYFEEAPDESNPVDTMTGEAFGMSPEQPPMPEIDMGEALVVPKTIVIDDKSVDVSKMQELDPELIRESGAVSYEVWKDMSRKEREQKGLPTSEIGAQIRYANRNGGYDILKDGWNAIKNFADGVKKMSEQDLPKGYEGDTVSFTDTRNASAAEQLRLALRLGRVNYGDTVIVNGKLMVVKKKDK